MPFAIQQDQLTLFIGDSITDCWRRGEHAPLGNGYARLAVDLIGARYPGEGRRFLNRGIFGHTVRNLRARWRDDCLRHRPDWVSIMIGINDLSGWLAGASDPVVGPGEFAEHYEQILADTRRETSAGLILMTPFYISTISPGGGEDHSRARLMEHLPAYLKVVEELAARHGARLVRTHEAFQTLLRERDAEDFAPEPVHPNLSGHVVLAHEWLRVMGW